MTEIDHCYLQAFRTICREIYTKQHYIQKLQTGLDDYRRLRDAFIEARVNQVQSVKPRQMMGVTFKNDPIENRGAEEITELSETLVQLERLYRGTLDALKNGTSDVVLKVSKFDVKFPVCLSGIGGIGYRWDGSERRAICVLAVIPEATATNFIIGAEKAHADFLDYYMSNDGGMAILGRVESWMCHGSDHWFMTPSAWQAIPQARKEAICSRILDPMHSFAYPLEFSILDGLRIKILGFIEDQLRNGAFMPPDVDQVKLIIADEKAKLNWIGP